MTDQMDLFGELTSYEAAQFGAVLPEDFDTVLRSDRQRWAVLRYTLAHEWSTLEAIAGAINAPIQSVSARLRDLRKPQFGGHTVPKRLIRKGVWEYSVILNRGGRLV